MNEQDFRIEKDSMGEVKVPASALYAAQTQRAVENFPVSGLRFPRAFIKALGLVKGTAAQVNQGLGLLDASIADAIVSAASEVEAGQHDAHFPVDIFQTGSGTSTNMNTNEVIATLATQRLGAKVHPNDHVNCSQSSNDVIPTAIHVSALQETAGALIPSMDYLASVIEKKAAEVDHVVTTGRTHLMDAMPIRLSQELGGWAAQVRDCIQRIEATYPRIGALALGGTAIGTGINAHPEFGGKVADSLAAKTGLPFKTSANYFVSLSSLDAVVELSGQLKTFAVALMKIANDLRWMNSGPIHGIAEIALPSLQPGSSIMPAKVNPVVPESAAMVCAQVIGNDATITIAGQSGNFQLNVMLPVAAYNLLESIHILGTASRMLADKAIAGFTVNEAKIASLVEMNPILVTALNPVIGYEKGAAVAKYAFKEGRRVKDVAAEQTDLSPERLNEILDPRKLTEGGVAGS
jgi:fumarate hydratase, class II